MVGVTVGVGVYVGVTDGVILTVGVIVGVRETVGVGVIMGTENFGTMSDESVLTIRKLVM